MKLIRIIKRIISEPSPFDLEEVYKFGKKEYRDIKGIRPDYVDLNKGIIYELKPGNPTGVRQGMRQLDKYVDRFNLERPLNNGRKWEGVLDLY